MTNFKQIINELVKKFPSLPEPKPWEKHDKKRYYFNHPSHTFFIDYTDINNIYIGLKKGEIWSKIFPSKDDILDFIKSKIGDTFRVDNTITEDHVSSEFFQIKKEKIKKLYCYELKVSGDSPIKIGGKLQYRLGKKLGGMWAYSKRYLWSDKEFTREFINKKLNELYKDEKGNEPIIRLVEEIIPKGSMIPPSQVIAKYIVQYINMNYKNAIKNVLHHYNKKLGNIHFIRESRIREWVIKGMPVLSISIKTLMRHEYSLDKLIKTNKRIKDNLKGLRVINLDNNHVGYIIKINGILKEKRNRLISMTNNQNLKKKLQIAPDDDLVITIGEKEQVSKTYDYAASTLHPIVETKNVHLFGVSPKDVIKYLTISPQQRNIMVEKIANIIHDWIDNRIDSFSFPFLFKIGQEIGFSDLLKFGDNSTHSKKEYVLLNLERHGIYKLSENVKKNREIKLVLIKGSISFDINFFINKLKKEFEKLKLKLIIAKRISLEDLSHGVFSEKFRDFNDLALDMILVLLPSYHLAFKNQDEIYEFVKSKLSSLTKLASQFVFENTLKKGLNFALANIILGILAKAGCIPYVLAKPLSFCDLLLGIDISRKVKESLAGTHNVAAMARFYSNEGTLFNYEIFENYIEGETIPKNTLWNAFQDEKLHGKTIVIHRDGYFRKHEIPTLEEIGKRFNIKFKLVEILKRNVPRLYLVEKGEYKNARENQILYLNDKAAIVINLDIKDNRTASPLRIEVKSEDFSINDAIISVMGLRIMNFGCTKASRLPVTIASSDMISRLLIRGIKPPEGMKGTKPWWY